MSSKMPSDPQKTSSDAEIDAQTVATPPVKKGLFSRLFGRGSPEKSAPQPVDQNAKQVDEPVLVTPQNELQSDTQNVAPVAAPEITLDVVDSDQTLQQRSKLIDDVEAGASSTAETAPKLSWWQRLTSGLKRTSSGISEKLASLLFQRKLDADTLEELEDILIQADLGLPVASRITKVIKEGRFDKGISPDEVRTILAHEIETILTPVAQKLTLETAAAQKPRPFVILMVGVNGAGKTTSIGKLAHLFAHQGLKVMLAAGDTFRAAAIEQLKVWGERTGAQVIAREQGADAAGLVYDAYQAAVKEKMDVLLIDTAGRLQNKTGLMAELEKVVRVLKKADPDAPHAALLVLDATVGQNAVSQVDLFTKSAGVTGLIMTKLDGTARGGILVALAEKFKLPVHFIGVGESLDDLEPFTARDFARAIAGFTEK